MSIERTDPAAAHRAAQQIRDQLPPELAGRGVVACDECNTEIELDDDSEQISQTVADQFVAAFERRVNEHGVAVRRVVLYGPEEVDPNPPVDAADPVAGFMTWVAEQYRRAIVHARAAVASHEYEKANGRAEAYRQAAQKLGQALSVAVPDWEAIKANVPADGVYRTKATPETVGAGA